MPLFLAAINIAIYLILELRELFYGRAIRGYQIMGKIPFDHHIIYIVAQCIIFSNIFNFLPLPDNFL